MFKAVVTCDHPNPPAALVKQASTATYFEVRFVPTQRTTYTLDVQLSNKSIKESPAKVSIQAMGMASSTATGQSMKIGVSVPKDSAVAKTPFSFKIVYSDVPDPSAITCKIIDSNGVEVLGELSNRSNGNIDVTLIPQIHGYHKIVPYYEGCVVSGNMGFECSPEPTAKVIGKQERDDGVRGSPYTIQVGSINCVLANFKFAVKGPPGPGGASVVIASFNLNPNGTDTGITTSFAPMKGGKANPNGVENGIFSLTFTPTVMGPHTFVGFLNGKPLTGAPVVINVGPSVDAGIVHGNVMSVNVGSPAGPTSPKSGYSAPSAQAQAQIASPKGAPAQFSGQPAAFGGQPAQFGGQPAQFGGQPAQFGGQPAQFGGQQAGASVPRSASKGHTPGKSSSSHKK